MTLKEGTAFVRALIWALIRIRSIMTESMAGWGADMTEIGDGDKQVLNALHPDVFTLEELYDGTEPEYSLLKHAMLLEAKGDSLAPIDLYNLLIMIYRNPETCMLINTPMVTYQNYQPIESYVGDGLPTWLAGWKDAI